MAYDTIIAGGTVFSDKGKRVADVAIEGGKIASVAAGLARNANGATVVDATGKYVIPGALDVHVHLELPFCGTTSSDDFDSGTRAAACGGVTTLIDFAIPRPGESLQSAHENWLGKAKPKACIDYAWHMAITNFKQHVGEMAGMVAAGLPTFKEFMIYRSEGWMADDAAIFGALEQTKKLKAMLLIHAESALVLEELIARHHTPELMARYGARLHAMTRPNYIEAEAIQRAVKWAEVTGGRLYIVHMSTGEGARIIRQAQKDGIKVFAETCIQYLVLDDSVFKRKDGHLFACCPQLKKPKDQERLWKGLDRGEVSVISTDTCTFTREQKDTWQGDWTKIPMGMPGLETMFPLAYTHGVLADRISMSQLVAKCCTNPAKLMGLYPQKGTLSEGSDADVVIFDPHKKIKVNPATMQTRCDWSPYDGWSLAGFAETTFSRGRKIVDNYKFVGANGDGQFLPRKKPGKL